MIPNEDKTARQCFYGFLTAIKRYFVQIQLANATSLYIYICAYFQLSENRDQHQHECLFGVQWMVRLNH